MYEMKGKVLLLELIKLQMKQLIYEDGVGTDKGVDAVLTEVEHNHEAAIFSLNI